MYKYLLVAAVSLLVSSCQRAGGYRDLAMITDAQRAIRRVRNALEEYWVDHGRYPEEGVDLESLLHPYFTRIRFRQTDDAPLHTAAITNARDQLTSISRLLSGTERQVVPRLDSLYREEFLTSIGRIEQLIASYRLEIEAEEMLPVDIDAEKEIETMLSLLQGLNPDSLLLSMEQQLIEQGDNVIMLAEELKDEIKNLPLDSLKISGIIRKTDGISRTFRIRTSILKGEKIRETDIIVPERELSDIERMLDLPDSNAIQAIENVRQGIEIYESLEMEKENISFLIVGIKSLERTKSLLIRYERTVRGDVKRSAKIVLANTTLHEMARALESYRRQFGSYPEDRAAIKPVIHHSFIEITMGGDTIDRNEEKLSLFKEFPSYSVTESGFMLKARVADDAGTPVFCGVEIISEWDKVVSAFAEEPIYRTEDPQITYFLTARAKDSERTIVFDRPPVRKRIEKNPMSKH